MNTTHRGQACTVLSVACFLTVVSVALLSIGRELHFSESGLRWVVTAHGLTFGGLLLLGGWAADLLGRRRVFLRGLTVFTGVSLVCGLAWNDTLMGVMRAVQGTGAVIVLPAALSTVMTIVRPGRRPQQGSWRVGRARRGRRTCRPASYDARGARPRTRGHPMSAEARARHTEDRTLPARIAYHYERTPSS